MKTKTTKKKTPKLPIQKTLIFEYKGRVGIKAGTKFINDPSKPGQLGCIVNVKEIEISKTALDILMNITKNHDAIGDLMCWKAGDINCFGWMGGYTYLLHPQAQGDRDYTPSLLKSQVSFVPPPPEFTKAVNKLKKSR